MSTFRRVVDIVGRILIGGGVVLLLFTAYQIWGTSIQEAHTQSGLRTQLQQETNSEEIRHALAEESALTSCPPAHPSPRPGRRPPPKASPSVTSASR